MADDPPRYRRFTLPSGARVGTIVRESDMALTDEEFFAKNPKHFALMERFASRDRVADDGAE